MIYHKIAFRKLGRTASHRMALLRTMTTQLVEHGRIATTIQKAKELRRKADQMITLGKKGTLHHRRQALGFLRTKEAVKKVFDHYAKHFENRPGGYTRIIRTTTRRGDNAQMCYIEFVPESVAESRLNRLLERKERTQRYTFDEAFKKALRENKNYDEAAQIATSATVEASYKWEEKYGEKARELMNQRFAAGELQFNPEPIKELDDRTGPLMKLMRKE